MPEGDVGKNIQDDGSRVEDNRETNQENCVYGFALRVLVNPADSPEVEEVYQYDALSRWSCTWMTRKNSPIILQAVAYPSNTWF